MPIRYKELADGKDPAASPKVTPEGEVHLTIPLARNRLWTALQLQGALSHTTGAARTSFYSCLSLEAEGYAYMRMRYMPGGTQALSYTDLPLQRGALGCCFWMRGIRGVDLVHGIYPDIVLI